MYRKKIESIYPITFIITFLWLGFVLSISFMEAPIKFTAPSLTLSVGLDVGSHVFSALNKVELFFAGLTFVIIFLKKTSREIIIVFILAAVILLLQTIWMLPELNERVLIYLKGDIPPESSIHIFYIIGESIKVMLLAIMGWFQIKEYKRFLLNNS